jgi:hypothetical protein
MMAHLPTEDFTLISLLSFLVGRALRIYVSIVLLAVRAFLDKLILFVKVNILHFSIFDQVLIDLDSLFCSFVSFLFSVSELSQTVSKSFFAS